jgi:hypothetical protein
MNAINWKHGKLASVLAIRKRCKSAHDFFIPIIKTGASPPRRKEGEKRTDLALSASLCVVSAATRTDYPAEETVIT